MVIITKANYDISQARKQISLLKKIHKNMPEESEYLLGIIHLLSNINKGLEKCEK